MLRPALSALFVLLILAGLEWGLLATCVGDDRISYARQIQPILARRCYACHGPDEATRAAGLALHQRDLLLAETDSGERAVVPGRPQRSELLARVTSDDEYTRMPPAEHGPPLTSAEIDLLRHWIAEGAEFETHWAYRPIVSPEIPEVKRVDWPQRPIDYFVLAGMESHGLTPNPSATRSTLLRRVSLDLTGLPPTREELQEFLADTRPDAYERCVDRLLSSPAYGEHWARSWFDLARYADSQGYAQDELRSIWLYRDWVIAALNADLPFDQFTIEQLAGDLLPNPTESQLIATGFHRNTMTNTEGGTDDEEFRHAAIVDRVNTTGTVWLATTLACAQCHTHKYDPITHAEYYRLYALFNQTADNDQPDNSPLLEVWTEEERNRRDSLLQQIAALESSIGDSGGASEEIQTHLAAVQEQLAQVKPTTTPIMRELPVESQRVTRICVGGAHHTFADPVEPGVPVAFQFSDWQPANRLELAQWLVHDDNPLVARVIVNRQWEQLFGRGLVVTGHDFGTQGNLPTHPELLDWLAVEFRRGGWSLKHLTKLIVMSATYQQSSHWTDAARTSDPDNRWLSRGARYRLSAETLRDYALAVSGLLSKKMYGPPVRPLQPKSGLNAAFGGTLDWEPSSGEDRYRRGVYTLWRRVYPYPSFLALDATNRTVCTAQRVNTNTPVGVFVTLNDPAFVECAQALARRVLVESPATVDARLAWIFETVVCRSPRPDEMVALRALAEEALREFTEHPDSAALLAGPVSSEDGVQPVDVAVWTLIANTLLNLDEVLTRN